MKYALTVNEVRTWVGDFDEPFVSIAADVLISAKSVKGLITDIRSFCVRFDGEVSELSPNEGRVKIDLPNVTLVCTLTTDGEECISVADAEKIEEEFFA